MDTHKLIDGVGLAVEAVTTQTEAEFVKWVSDAKASGSGFPWNDERAKQIHQSIMAEVQAEAEAASMETSKLVKKPK